MVNLQFVADCRLAHAAKRATVMVETPNFISNFAGNHDFTFG